MQTAIVILIVAAAALFLIRRFCSSVKKSTQSTCGCSCDGCGPNQKENCSEIESPKQ